eukprot:m.4986 g.4986  ORF g.4986 m.4986 type:complete len:64 (-) comp3902_c0_seq1:25-216(-)
MFGFGLCGLNACVGMTAAATMQATPIPLLCVRCNLYNSAVFHVACYTDLVFKLHNVIMIPTGA